MEQSEFPNTYNLEVDADKIDPNGVLAIRVSFHSPQGYQMDQALTSVSTGTGTEKLRWSLLDQYVGQPAVQKDDGQVIFRVRAASREAPINTIDVEVGAAREFHKKDILIPPKSIIHQTCRVRLYKTN